MNTKSILGEGFEKTYIDIDANGYIRHYKCEEFGVKFCEQPSLLLAKCVKLESR